MDKSVIEENWHARHFTTQTEFLTWMENEIAVGRMDGELTRNRQGQGGRSDLIGEIAYLREARLVNRNLNNPCWECKAWCDAVPGKDKIITVIAWGEDMSRIAGDANVSPWVYYVEMTDSKPTHGPKGLNIMFLVRMDSDLNYRSGEIPVELRETI